MMSYINRAQTIDKSLNFLFVTYYNINLEFRLQNIFSKSFGC